MLRAIRDEAWENHKAFLLLKDTTLVGIMDYGPGDRAYRKLSPAILNRETRDLVRRQFPEDETV